MNASTKPQTTAAERIEQARVQSGLSAGRVHRWSRRRLIPDRTDDYAPSDWVALANLLGVDPRWLYSGELAPGVEQVLARLDREMRLTAPTITEADAVRVMDLIATMPIAPPYPGTCRYCGCTDECGCGACYWVDDEQTICSACLEPQG